MFGSRAFDEPNPPIFAFVPSAIDFRISLNFDNHLWPFLVNNHVLTILLQYSIQNNKLSKRRRKNSLWWSWWRTPAKLYCYRYRHTNTHFLLHIACTLTVSYSQHTEFPDTHQWQKCVYCMEYHPTHWTPILYDAHSNTSMSSPSSLQFIKGLL